MRGEPIGLAIIGCGTIGRIRAVLARETLAVGWLGLCDIDEETALQHATSPTDLKLRLEGFA